MHIISGKKLSVDIQSLLSKIVKETGIQPHLGIITAGKTKPIETYIKQKEKFGIAIGGAFTHVDLTPSGNDVEGEIAAVTNRSDVHGLILQLPVHESFEAGEIVSHIPIEKDVDGMRPENLGALLSGDTSTLISATVRGIERIMETIAQKEKISFESWVLGKHVVIVNHSNLIGKPLAALLVNKDATVTLAHKFTQNLIAITKNADIVISATGQPGLITKEYIKEGAVVIDAGIEFVNGKIIGDVKQDDFKAMDGWITPVPGGVGPMTVACLWENVVKAALVQNEYSHEDIQNLFA